MEARVILVSYPNDGRQLKRLITALLKSGAAKCIQRFNYVKSYYMREGKMKQEEEKILLIKTTEDKLAKLQEILTKNHPYSVPEIITIVPDGVNEKYLSRLAN
jgi:periplasmic divalent cation tolerance protein